jgi:hypothetical protein
MAHDASTVADVTLPPLIVTAKAAARAPKFDEIDASGWIARQLGRKGGRKPKMTESKIESAKKLTLDFAHFTDRIDRQNAVRLRSSASDVLCDDVAGDTGLETSVAVISPP